MTNGCAAFQRRLQCTRADQPSPQTGVGFGPIPTDRGRGRSAAVCFSCTSVSVGTVAVSLQRVMPADNSSTGRPLSTLPRMSAVDLRIDHFDPWVARPTDGIRSHRPWPAGIRPARASANWYRRRWPLRWQPSNLRCRVPKAKDPSGIWRAAQRYRSGRFEVASKTRSVPSWSDVKQKLSASYQS